MKVDFLKLREALEHSWDEKTSYRGVKQAGNPALGNCYPTSWVIQQFFPEMEIVKGEVWTGKSTEIHFWNVLSVGNKLYHIDLSWQQFPPGSQVRKYDILDRDKLGDSQPTIERCNLLKQRVSDYINNH